MTPRSIYSFVCYVLLIFSTQTYSQIYEIKQGDKWGFIDATGSIVLPPVYDFIYDDYAFSRQKEGYFVVMQDQKMGVYHRDRKTIVPPMYDRIKVHSNADLSGYIEVEQNGKVGILDTLGQILRSPQYDEIRMLLPGVFTFSIDGVWGVWNRSGTFDIPASFHEFSTQDHRYLLAKRGNLSYAWDENGIQRLADFRGSVSFLTSHTLSYKEVPEELIPIQQEEEESDIADESEDDSEEGLEDNENADKIQDQDSTEIPTGLGLLDSTGTKITPAIFDTLTVHKGFIHAQRDRFVGLYNSKGRLLLDYIYSNIQIDASNHIWVNLEGKWGVYEYVNDTLGLLMSPSLINMGRFIGNVAVVEGRGGMGVLNQYGELVVNMIYSSVYLSYGNAMVFDQDLQTYKQIPLTEDGSLAKKKRLVIRGTEESEATATQGNDERETLRPEEVDPRVYGWFRRKKLWGWRDSTSKRIRISPRYTKVIVYPDLGLSLAMIQTGKAKDRKIALITHRTGRINIPLSASIAHIYMNDFQDNPVARAQYSTGAFCLINRQAKIYPLKRTAYIGTFSEGCAPACISMLYPPIPKHPLAENPKQPIGMRGKWGYVTEEGKWGVEARYQAAHPFSNGIGIFQLNDKWGGLDSSFQQIIAAEYDAIRDPAMRAMPKKTFGESQNLERPPSPLIATLINRKKIFYLTGTGNLLFSRPYDASKDFHEGLAAVKVGRKWGYINPQGEMVIKPQFDRANDFHQGLACVRNRMRWGFINSQGEYVIESLYQLAGDFVDGIAMVKYQGKYGYLNLQGKWHIRPRFKKAYSFSQGRAIARGSGWVGVIDTKGEWVVPPQFSRIWRTDNGYYRVKRKGVFGYYSREGEECLKPYYRMISKVFESGIARVYSKDGWGYINTNYRLISDTTYTFVRPFSFHMGLVKKGDYWGVMNQSGDYILKPEYAEVIIVDYGQFKVRQSKWGLSQHLDLRNQLPPKPLTAPPIIPLFETINSKFGYDKVHDESESVIVAECEELLGLFDYEGNQLFEPQFESIRYINGLYKVIKDGNIGYLNPKGKWVYKIE